MDADRRSKKDTKGLRFKHWCPDSVVESTTSALLLLNEGKVPSELISICRSSAIPSFTSSISLVILPM